MLFRVLKLWDSSLSKNCEFKNLKRNPEDYSQMSRMLVTEARERWDLFNEINRTKKK